MLFNIFMNLAGNITAMVLGLVAIPHIVGSFGVASYGLWSLVAGSTALLGMLELGVAGAIFRLLAANRERTDATPAAVILSTGLVILGAVGLAILALTLVAAHAFFELYSVPEAQSADVRLALLACGTAVAINLAGAIGRGYLWSRERFDLINAIEIAVSVIRLAAIFQLIGPGSELSELAVIQLTLSILTQTLLVLACWLGVGGFRVDPRLFDRKIAKEIYSVGIWYFLLSSSRNYLPQIAMLVIGYRLSPIHVATYAVASQLAGYTRAVADDATQVVAPRAAALHGASRVSGAAALFIDGGRLATALALLLVGGVLCFGRPFIELWQHGRIEGAYPILVVLALGELAAMTQAVTYSSIMATGRMKPLAALAVAEVALVLVLALLLVHPYGALGVAVAIAAPSFLLRGVGRWIYGCRVMNVSLASYAARVLAPVGMTGLAGVLAGMAVVGWLAPSSWPGLVLSGAAYLAVFAITVGPVLIRRGERGLAGSDCSMTALRKAK